jgi:sarcosine oxidase subunit alpha
MQRYSFLTLARSFKFHRPRGIVSAGLEELGALVQVAGRTPHAIPAVRATECELTSGLEASAIRGWPSLRFDVGRLLDVTAPLWPAGFYNKMFIWPSWHLYERTIRRLAGFGHAPTAPDPSRYEPRNLHCDVLIVGGGAAGLSAALDSASLGVRVVLVEHSPTLGGYRTVPVAAPRALIDRLRTFPNVTIMTRTTAVGIYDHNVVTLSERAPPPEFASTTTTHTDTTAATDPAPRCPWRERFWTVRTRHIILATGAIEQPLIFDHNDRPGIFLAGALEQYLRRHAVLPARRLVLATNNDTIYSVARALANAGAHILAIADSRLNVSPTHLNAMRALGIQVRVGAMPIATAGARALAQLTLGLLTPGGTLRSRETIRCEALGVSGGWSPTLHLYAQGGAACASTPRPAACARRRHSRTSASSDLPKKKYPSDPASAPRVIPAGNGSICFTMSPSPISTSRSARTTPTSSTSSATPPSAWPPTKARPPQRPPLNSSQPVAPSPPPISDTPPTGRRSCPSPSAPSPAAHSATASPRAACCRSTPLTWSWAL